MLGLAITELRDRLGLTMSALAKRLSVDVNLIVDWENDVQFPTKRHALALERLASEVSPAPTTSGKRKKSDSP